MRRYLGTIFFRHNYNSLLIDTVGSKIMQKMYNIIEAEGKSTIATIKTTAHSG